ncbi:hypothetical protein RJ640_002729 [Escallonia rubra]|uniref:non-specific serine/threonine protein kinase n=1 Tax=Escallonia rubra TaxID=112253 RepID=A0AA88RCM0_9ASTE|nr:hypothetical protein RJ640_002729 [Escallonia rubra]
MADAGTSSVGHSSKRCDMDVAFIRYTSIITGSTALVNTNETDRQALLAVKDLISGDPLAVLSSWNQSVHFCHWQGVTCGVRHQRVTGLDLSSQELVGSLSPQIGNLTFLRAIRLDNNSFRGPIPKEIGRLFRLKYLSLYNNSFQGIIPESVGKLSEAVQLGMSENNISGEIPPSLGNITGLSTLILRRNMIEGSIPTALGNCTRLQILDLGYNRLTGPIPKQLIRLSSLTDGFRLGPNYLSGPLPPEVGNLKNLRQMDISRNKLFGEIPSTLGDCQLLEFLFIQNNLFEGTIPPSFKQLKGIQELDLSSNNLSGQIPGFLGELTLLHSLNLSHNMFEGEVPTEGVFSKISASSIVGNNRLCGGIPALQLPACPKMVPNKEKRPILHIIVPLVVVLSVVLLLACLALIFYRRKKSQKQASSTSQLQNQYQKLSYAELSEATNRFASTNLIGEGRYGAVYRGTLNTAEQVVAVKVLKLQEHGASKSFKAECEALRNLRHRNLVKIITTCTSLDNQGNDFKALIFEFMPNGSLDSWLHPITPEKQDSKSLNLVQRLNIAIDVASALDYLHHHCETAISHCDLKPSNVLLDNDLCAHVSDFGLAKFILTSVSVSSHTHSSSTGIRGTIGYLAPEYGMGEEVSTQGDVYSYGIMLLEMFTGKRPTDGMFKDNLSLHNYVKLALPDRVMEIVDCKIMLLEEANKIKQRKGYVAKVESCIASILQIGLSCSADLPSERMDVGDVLMELHQIRHFHSREIELAERELEIHNSVKDKSVSSRGYVAVWPTKDHPTFRLFELEHCLVDPQNRESRVRIIQVLRVENSELVLQNTKVFVEQWYGPFRNGEQLGGCAICDSTFAATDALKSSQITDGWQGLNVVARFQNSQNHTAPNMTSRLVPSPYFLSCSVFFYLLFVGAFTTIGGFTNETDLQALLSFKKLVTEDPLQALGSWNESLPFCSWRGVTCSLRHQRVTVLNMSSLKLVGSLSPHVGNLTFLRELNLGENNFHGTIPQESGRMFRLQYLRLANNFFQGSLPTNLTYCSNLRIIDLTLNNLEGNVPAGLSSLSNLNELSLGRNNFTGMVPVSLGNLSSLRILDLSRNYLHGSIPEELGLLSNLEVLELSSNNLSGTIPLQLYNISYIQTFSITNNLLSGSFPPNLGLSLPNLKSFLVAKNRFSGSIPVSLANASGLVHISAGQNAFTGPIPPNLGSLQELEELHFGGNPLGTDKSNNISFLSSLTNCTNLRVLSLYGMQLEGALPSSFANLSTTLTSVWLDENYITGSIPVGIENLAGLSYLTIDTNLLTGSIPDSIGKLTGLQELYLFMNNLTGIIPSSIGNITGLSILILMDNRLEGSIPASLGNCRGLQDLHLAGNRLSGEIPKQVVGLSSLSIGLNLAGNYLTGSLPSEVGNLKNLALLRVSENRLTGEIPSTLGNCLMLESLDMEGNFFEGAIPSTLGQLKGIQAIDLSRNNLSGLIPSSLGKLRLITNLNLSFNMLEGDVPNEGVFTNISEFSVSNNKKLCGGTMALMLPACPAEITRKQRRVSSRTVIILATTLSISFILFLAGICAIFLVKRSKKQPSKTSAMEKQHHNISYAELLQSTNEFSAENLIGEGRYGSVFKSVLSSGEQTVAVKVLKLEQMELRKVSWQNSIKESSSQEPCFSEQHDARILNIWQRLDIAIDVASALDYLHHQYGTPIVHCDLKPANILLDNDLCARVSDFGLAKFLSATKTNPSAAQSSSTGIRGTVGYVPPEYGMGEEVSTQGDVYSYGILLLEMFTGKRPTNSMFTESLSLHNYVKKALPYQVMEIAIPEISLEAEDGSDKTSKCSNGSMVQIEECLLSILRIGVSCSAEMPRERMDINDVLMELHRTRNAFLQVRREQTLITDIPTSSMRNME